MGALCNVVYIGAVNWCFQLFFISVPYLDVYVCRPAFRGRIVIPSFLCGVSQLVEPSIRAGLQSSYINAVRSALQHVSDAMGDGACRVPRCCVNHAVAPCGL